MGPARLAAHRVLSVAPQAARAYPLSPENALARLGEAIAFSSQNRVCSLALLLHLSASLGCLLGWGGRRRSRQRNAIGVHPQAVEIVHATPLGLEHVHHDIHEID